MTRKQFVFLLAIVAAAGIIFIITSKSNEKNRIILKEVMDLHQGSEPKIEKIVEARASLKRQIETLKAEAQDLKEAAKKSKLLGAKLGDKKEEAEKAEYFSSKSAEIEALAQELEELEADLHSWKEDLASTLKSKKDKINKEMQEKLAAAKTKFNQLNDRFVKSMEKVEKWMQQPHSQEKTE